jgi:hypothetical protein
LAAAVALKPVPKPPPKRLTNDAFWSDDTGSCGGHTVYARTDSGGRVTLDWHFQGNPIAPGLVPQKNGDLAYALTFAFNTNDEMGWPQSLELVLVLDLLRLLNSAHERYVEGGHKTLARTYP